MFMTGVLCTVCGAQVYLMQEYSYFYKICKKFILLLDLAFRWLNGVGLKVT